MRPVTSPARRLTALAAASAALAAVSVAPATASPPIPLATKLSTLARAQAVGAGELGTPPGSDAVSSMFELPAGSGSGWQRWPGTVVLAVTGGKLTVHAAEGCTTTTYEVGEAAVLRPGRYAVANATADPVSFAGVFANLPGDRVQPLLQSRPVKASCADVPPSAAADLASTTLTDYVRGTMVPLAAYGKSLHARHAKSIVIEQGKDIAVGAYSFQPGFSSGWITHAPALTIVGKGTIAYYESIDGRCVKSEEYGRGQAYNHVGGVHVGVNEGDEPFEAIIVWFNLPHASKPSVPVVGDVMDEVDFTPVPPTECVPGRMF